MQQRLHVERVLRGMLEPSLRQSAAEGRHHKSLTSFDLFIDPSPSPYLNLAVPKISSPKISSQSWPAAIAELVASFNEHERQPRLEYFHELYPDLAGALLAAGFKQDMRAPVMVLGQEAFQFDDFETAEGVYRALGGGERGGLEQILRSQSLAYGGDGGEDSLIWLPQLLKRLENGSTMIAALFEGEPIAGASIQIGNGIGELAGVWTLPQRQQQGLAFKVCQHLLQAYFASGYPLCWLSAADGAQRLYQKLGFITVGTQLNFSLN